MRHLTSVELVDLAEGTRAESSAPHLDTCEACRHQLAELRAAMSTTEAFDVPEPSPLFWDHLSGGEAGAAAAPTEPLAEDPSLALVADLAADLDWGGATDAGLTAVGGADGAINQLNADERRELDRLLKEALAKPGA